MTFDEERIERRPLMVAFPRTDLTDEAWRHWRQQGIGGSDISAVVGLNPWTSRWALWAEKTGLVESDDDDNETAEFGLRAEGMIAGYFRDRKGLYVVGEQTCLVHPEHPWARATCDGFVAEYPASTIDNTLGPLELKVTTLSPQEWEAGIPDHYECQALWQMAVSGASHEWFAVLHLAFGRPRVRFYEIERNQANIDYLLREGAAFWDLVQSGTPPAVDGTESTTKALGRAWEPDKGESVELDRTLYREYVAARATAEEWQRKTDELSNRIRAEMQSAAVATVDGTEVVTWRKSKAMNTTRLLNDLHWEDAVKLLHEHGFELSDHLKFDLAGWGKANRRRAETYKTEPGTRRFLLKEREL